MAQGVADNEPVDFSIFEKPTDDDEACIGNKGHYATCLSINRLAYGLRYYSVLNLRSNSSHLAVFTNFIGELYARRVFINDYIHFMEHHEEEVKEIKTYLIDTLKLFKPCDIKQCKFTARHQSADHDNHIDDAYDDDDYIEREQQDEQQHDKHRKPKRKANQFDANTALYQRTFDALHFCLFHLFDAGLRIDDEEQQETKQQPEEQANQAKHQYFDAALARINQMILERAHITSSFARFRENNQQHKFNMHAVDETKKTNKKKHEETYLDSIYKRLHALKFGDEVIAKLRSLLEDEHYDSEAFTNDMAQSTNEVGNILQALSETDETFANYVASIVRAQTAKSFSVGYRFYYWQWFKHRQGLEGEYYTNTGLDHGGYAVRDMYVRQKHQSFKQELLEYGHDFNVKKYNEHVLPKAKALLLSNKAKAMKADWWRIVKPSLDHYGVDEGQIMRLSNFVSVILYTDYSLLSASFSSSFRKKSAFETLQQTKKRNSAYWWWAKTLRETVELYGQNNIFDKVVGPFYCGVSVRLSMPSFLIRLHAPTSTTVYQAVARNFCGGNQGIIIQLNNNTYEPVIYLKGLNVSWISRYPSEAERLFCGGYFPIQIESILVMQTNHNLQTVMATLYTLDRMVSGQEEISTLSPRRDDNLFSSLFAFSVGDDTKVRFDEYVAHTFTHYINQKTKIYLNFHMIHWSDGAYITFKDLLMSKKKKQLKKYSDEMDGELRVLALSEEDDTNLFNQSLLRLFRNATSLRIHAGDTSLLYPFSFMSLLKLIGSSLLTKIVITAWRGTLLEVFLDKDNECWSKIMTAYNNAGYDIRIEPEIIGDYRHCVISKR